MTSLTQRLSAFAISFTLGACATAHKPELLGTVPLKNGSEPQSCKDYKILSAKGPDAYSLLRSGAYGLGVGAIGRGVEGVFDAKRGTAEILGGGAAVIDLITGTNKLTEATNLAARQCDTDLKALRDGALCAGTTELIERGASADGRVGNTAGYETKVIRCDSLGTRPRPGGLN